MTDNEKLKSLLKNLDVPEMRRELSLTNLRWLERNLGIRNYFKPDYHDAMLYIKSLFESYPEWKY